MNTSALDKVLFNLNTLASCPRGGKIMSTTEYIVIEAQSYWQGLARGYRADTKERAAARIGADVQLAVEFATLMLENPAAHVEKLKNILMGLRAAAIGIDRLRSTYAGYESFLAPAKSISDTITATDSAITRALQSVGKY